MRIPSGVTDQYIYFTARDSTTGERKTGLSSFTAYRSRNGGAATAYTTPTITELDSVNMPGDYKFLLDEDMTIDSGDASQEYLVHISATGMARVSRTFELYRPPVSAGETLTVASGKAAATIAAGDIANDAITAAALAADAGTELATAIWAAAGRTLTALDEDNTTLDLDATIRNAVGLASANLDTQLDALPTGAELATALAGADDAVLAILGTPAGASVSVDIAAAKADTAAIKLKTDNLPTDPADASDVAGAFSAVNSTLGTIAAYIDTEVAAIKAKTDNLPTSPAAVGSAMTLTSGERDSVADALLDRTAGVETSRTLRQALRLMLAATVGKLSGAGTTNVIIRDTNDSKDRVNATVDNDGNRTAVTLDAS